ncbi:unnamed protein product, partial [Caretta caretta]
MVDSSRDPPAGVGELVQCDFDDNGHPFCRWTRPDAGDWMRTQGLAPGESPGPPGGTPERAGFYVTPVARAPGAVELRSPELAGASVVCLEFLYYVRGCRGVLARGAAPGPRRLRRPPVEPDGTAELGLAEGGRHPERPPPPSSPLRH